MAVSRTAACVLLLSVAFALVAAKIEKEDGVAVLTGDNWDDFVSKENLVLVEFYAPWCGHCKRLAPDYAAAAKKLEGKVPLGKVDATEDGNKELAEKFNVRGYPTLVVISDGGKVSAEYEGGRSVDEIVSYMEKQLLPTVTEVSLKKEIDDIIKNEKISFVGYLLDTGSKLYEEFKSAANALRNDIRFVHVTDKDVAEALNVTSATFVLYKSYDEPTTILEVKDDLTKDDIQKFISDNDLPLLDAIGPHNYRKYVSRSLPIGFVFIDPAQTEETEKLSAVAKQVAPKFRKTVLLATADGVKYQGHAKNLGLSGDSPFGFAIEGPDGSHYVFDEKVEITAEKLDEFLDGILDGKVKPFLKSEPEPESNDGPVRVIVGSTFAKEVVESDKDVLIEFYAPWCGHCKSLAPIYDELGTKVKDVKTLLIAKMDSTANDAPGFRIQSFPTLKFLPAGKKDDPLPYEGERTLEAMLSFVKEHATHKFELKEEPKAAKKPATDEDEEEDLKDEL